MTSVPLIGAGNEGRQAIVAITRCPAQGNGVSQDVARDIIDELDPSWLLTVGIAGGVPAAEFSLGDVVLASSVLDFTVEAVRAGGDREFAVEGRHVHHEVENYATIVEAHRGVLGPWYELMVLAQPGSDRVPLDQPPVSLEPGNFYGSAEWQANVRKSLEHHAARAPRQPRVIAGPIASSDRLMKDDELFAFWLKIARHVFAVEMESAGVHIAARGRARRKATPTMSIRGISDIVGFKRSEAWTRYACEAAAAFAYAFVRSGYVPTRRSVPAQVG